MVLWLRKWNCTLDIGGHFLGLPLTSFVTLRMALKVGLPNVLNVGLSPFPLKVNGNFLIDFNESRNSQL